MKTMKTKIIRTAIRVKASLAPLILICYPASVVAMFFLVGLLTCEGQKITQKSFEKNQKISVEKDTIKK